MGPEIALGLSAASTVMGAVGSIQSGRAASRQAEYQAQVARNNAKIAQQDAEYSAAAGEVAAQGQDFKNRATLGAIKAAQAASGISVDSPSLQDVYEGSAQVLRLDTQTLANNYALRTRAYQTRATNFLAESALQEEKASDATTASYLNTAGTLTSGAASFAEKWNKYKTPTNIS